jgi:hypothetical protein
MLRLSGAFDAHPNLKIILGHTGEGLPFLLWRVSHGLRAGSGNAIRQESVDDPEALGGPTVLEISTKKLVRVRTLVKYGMTRSGELGASGSSAVTFYAASVWPLQSLSDGAPRSSSLRAKVR